MSSIIKEFREFFTRNTQVNSGSKLDQEVGFPVSYFVNGISKFNRFLKGNYPSKNVFSKFFESITFKLNKEDRAQSSQQGLSIIASDSNVINRIDNATDGTEFTAFTTPRQIPDLKQILTGGGVDNIDSSITANGTILDIITTTILGKSKRNFRIRSAVTNSLEINSDGNIQLVNDTASPTETFSYYGINDSGIRGFYDLTATISAAILKTTHKFVKEFIANDIEQTFTITYSSLNDGIPFNSGTMGSSTTTNPKVDYQVQIWLLNSPTPSDTWILLDGKSISGDYSYSINASTGDITIVTGNNQGTYRV